MVNKLVRTSFRILLSHGHRVLLMRRIMATKVQISMQALVGSSPEEKHDQASYVEIWLPQANILTIKHVEINCT